MSRIPRTIPLAVALIAMTVGVVSPRAAAEVPPRWSGTPNDLDPADNGWDLLSGLPPGAENVRSDERDLGSGNWADRAWTLAKGRWDVRIAVLDSGIQWDERDLLYTAFLNPGELAGANAPRVTRSVPVTGAVIFAGAESDCTRWPGGPVGTQDVNGDGVFNLMDYWCDARMRPDAGVVAAWHVFDPGDLIALLSDGVDDDGNGYVDGQGDPRGIGDAQHECACSGRHRCGLCCGCGGDRLCGR